jgi:hypothetical protein
MFTLAMPQSEPMSLMNCSVSRTSLEKIEEARPAAVAFSWAMASSRLLYRTT